MTIPVLMLLAACSVMDNPAFTPDNLDELLNPIQVQSNYPALAAAVVRDGCIVATGAVGVRKWGDLTSVGRDDAFHLGSCTKAITATLVAMLIEEGKLQWDMALPDLFPELREEMHPDYLKVTIEHLLAHQGGLPNETWPDGKTFDDIHTLSGTIRERRMQYVAMILKQSPDAFPGTRFIYSNAGYTILGAIVERVTDTPWEQLMRERLFEPLHMTTAGFGPMGIPGKIEQPWQHKLVDGKPIPQPPIPRNDNPPAIAPSGQIHCSMGDWAAFLIAFMKDKDEGGLLRQDIRNHLLTPQFGGDYAGGWAQVEAGLDGTPAFQHSGSNTMNFCFVILVPEKQTAVLIATNCGGNLDTMTRESTTLANLLLKKYLGETSCSQ